MTTSAPQGIGWTDYRRFCEALALEVDEALTPARRGAVIPPWMSRELCATPAAVAKLHAWAQLRPPFVDRFELFERGLFIGDEAMAWQAAGVIAALPPPVTWYALERCRFYTVASRAGVLAFCAPSCSRPRPWTIVLSDGNGDGATFAELVAHELAHAHLIEEPAPNVELLNSFETMTILGTRLERVPGPARAQVRQLQSNDDRNERQARALAKAWGFGGEL